MKPVTSTQRSRARELRSQQTDAELRLWYRLRSNQVLDAKFRRQVPIGAYIADFCCLEIGLIVELDGGQHAEREQADHVRTAYLEQEGFRVIRFWTCDVLESTDTVLEHIANVVQDLRDEKRRYGP